MCYLLTQFLCRWFKGEKFPAFFNFIVTLNFVWEFCFEVLWKVAMKFCPNTFCFNPWWYECEKGRLYLYVLHSDGKCSRSILKPWIINNFTLFLLMMDIINSIISNSKKINSFHKKGENVIRTWRMSSTRHPSHIDARRSTQQFLISYSMLSSSSSSWTPSQK